MSKSDFPSTVTISGAAAPGHTVFEFLCDPFPKISPSAWQRRIESGKVLYENGNTTAMRDSAISGARIHYFRKVENEPAIPFNETILYMDEHILVVDKPHFLPVIPAGKYIHESLLYRLKKSTGMDDMVPVNRQDRHTVGIVLFSINRRSRDAYYDLFRKRLVHRSYKAISPDNPAIDETKWRIESRIVQGGPRFRMRAVDGDGNRVNAITDIVLHKCGNGLCYFSLHPETGQKHQLRVHMSLLGYPVLHDRLYPALLPEETDDFSKPLMLLADMIGFKDPLTGKQNEFRTGQVLETALPQQHAVRED
jgi:tRNA pseudouridine32 synthase / 23S rRNA pseudouridine746 synthase